jgi:hypothetical protein
MRGLPDTLFHGDWTVHVCIGYETELSVVDDRIGEGERALSDIEVESSVVRADGADFEGEDSGGELVAEGEPLNAGALRKLVQPRLVACDRDVEGSYEAVAVAIMVAIREEDALRPSILKPCEAPPTGASDRSASPTRRGSGS